MKKEYSTEEDIIKNTDSDIENHSIDDISVFENDDIIKEENNRTNEVDDVDIINQISENLTNSCDDFQEMDVETKKITVNDVGNKWKQTVYTVQHKSETVDNIWEESTGKKLSEDYKTKKIMNKLYWLIMLIGFITFLAQACHNNSNTAVDNVSDVIAVDTIDGVPNVNIDNNFVALSNFTDFETFEEDTNMIWIINDDIPVYATDIYPDKESIFAALETDDIVVYSYSNEKGNFDGINTTNDEMLNPFWTWEVILSAQDGTIYIKELSIYNNGVIDNNIDFPSIDLGFGNLESINSTKLSIMLSSLYADDEDSPYTYDKENNVMWLDLDSDNDIDGLMNITVLFDDNDNVKRLIVDFTPNGSP
jgi:hypothetical protein